MIKRGFLMILLINLAVASVAAAADPEPQEIVAQMIAAAGGDSFSKLGVVALGVREEETRSDGSQTARNYTAYVDTTNLRNLRLEMPGNVVIARFGEVAWATTKGQVDERRQTSFMARGTLNQRLFPLLMPFSLKMDGVRVTKVAEASWEGRDAWVLAVEFTKNFFTSPVLNTTWHLIVAKDDSSILSLEFVPSVEFQKVEREGIRYRILQHEDVGGAQIATWFLLNGINAQRQESGHVRVSKVTPTVRGPWEPALFMHPDELAKLEED